ncbi:hypothetical protein Q4566_05555 [Tamlana sp. 2_MG-2023]|uniref:DUF4175 family protein n=1 Tax=unclassified Tamlana TaxID=2614803 RepID=UPI0026E465DB|nr:MULTISPECIES: DUF4175 family protein [unclassified Tamlana]MDO6759660.1 hypothetical protein [Tamlana sp. 2_MG-2023]MDO6791283.1 hypothetical protein [Tamlana sp. 1_MG-2023]
MNNFKIIQQKLEVFIRRFYTNELLKGAILFFAMGLLYFLLTLFIESVLWLRPSFRTGLFWLFILVEFGLLIKFIFLPLAKLLKLQKGINYDEASNIIGKHFPEVNDKLLNVLQLHRDKTQSELLLASIEQKSLELQPVPFKLAVNFKENLGYLKYAAIPVIILGVIYLSGNINWFSDSYKRVVDYKTAYEPPAPFQFFVMNENLNAIESNDFKLIVKTAGDVVPENVQITYNDENYFLEQKGVGAFEYVFSQPKENIQFQLSSNNVYSKYYELHVIETPSLVSFNMILDYPDYTKKADDVFKSTGNALVPEGTKVTWKLYTKSTEEVQIFAKDTTSFKVSNPGVFETTKRLFNNYAYTLSTSNNALRNYENLAFNIGVVKDEYPEIKLKVEKDSVDLQSLYFYGQVSDDYGFSKLQMVYYPSNSENEKAVVSIPIANGNIADFISAFPNNLEIEAAVSYDLYFQVVDNDRVNNYKTAKSQIFSYRKRTLDEEEQRSLEEQRESIDNFNKSLEKFDTQEKKLDELTKTQREKKNLNFNDKKKLESFLKYQKQQDEMMKNFNKKLTDNLEEFQKENKKEDQFKEDLKERLRENEEQLKKDEKLLRELERLQEKINKEELIDKLEELSKQNKSKKRGLEQMLELTKRFYVEKKLEKLQDDLQKLAEAQEALSEKSKDENNKKAQDSLNRKFHDYKKEIENLEEESKALKKPIDIPRDKLDEKEVDNEQQKATEALQQLEEKETPESRQDAGGQENDQQLKNAQKSQKKAAEKMKQMSANMKGAMQAGGQEKMQEDMDMLRQILDNLVLFSFEEEDLMNRFKNIEGNHNKFASYLKKQNNLREYFEHVDDSLFALSLRQPKLSEQVNKEISEVYYNIDKALELFADNHLFQAISNQQFIITATNNLSDMLSDVLDNMEESMSMSAGKGGQGEMQLPDIIMGQEELNKMMEEGMKSGEEGKPKEGEGKQEGEGKEGKAGESGKAGEKGGDQDGNKGSLGKDGKGSKTGENGKQNGGEGEDHSEMQDAMLFEIYKQQQELRQALEERLAKEGLGGKGGGLVRQMEQIEMELLNKGFTKQTLQKMMNLKHQLLKMENATLEQGEDEKRESESSKRLYKDSNINQIPQAKQYFKTTEILNRQALPLQPVYKERVKEYFKESHD